MGTNSYFASAHIGPGVGGIDAEFATDLD